MPPTSNVCIKKGPAWSSYKSPLETKVQTRLQIKVQTINTKQHNTVLLSLSKAKKEKQCCFYLPRWRRGGTDSSGVPRSNTTSRSSPPTDASRHQDRSVDRSRISININVFRVPPVATSGARGHRDQPPPGSPRAHSSEACFHRWLVLDDCCRLGGLGC